MVNKTQCHLNHWTQWTIAEITFVEQHYSQLSAREIGEQLGWSANGVARISFRGITSCLGFGMTMKSGCYRQCR
ncbi:hypothetical protein E5284_14870 [Citrobacter freundii]|jgi:hypothetical protein|nr:hypothetical protein E5284_14870 [Citrobacter freundii]